MSTDGWALLKRVPLFAQLGEELLAGLATRMRRRTFRRGTIVFHKDQEGDALYIVESGHVRVFLPSEGGQELTVDMVGPGEVFGELALLDSGPRSASAEAAEPTIMFTLTRQDFRQELTQTPQLATAVIALLSQRLRRVTQYAESLAFLDIRGRLARVLLEMAERSGTVADGMEIDFPVTQTELATMIGATRERVNRTLATFRSQAIVEFHGKKLVLRDTQRLRLSMY